MSCGDGVVLSVDGNRRGVWGGRRGVLWPIYDTMTAAVHAGSDHAAIYADIQLGQRLARFRDSARARTGHPDAMSYAYPQPAYLQQPAPRTSAPIGVHFIAILYYLGGVFYLLVAAGAGVVLATGQLDRYSDRYNAQIPLSPDDRMAASIAVVAVLAIIGLITIWFGRRLQIGRNWARVLLNFFLLVSVGGIGYGAWRAQDPTVLIALVQPVFYLLLLNTRAARSWFRRHTW